MGSSHCSTKNCIWGNIRRSCWKKRRQKCQIHFAICRSEVTCPPGTLCSFKFICVCLIWMTTNNGPYNQANLIGFTTLSPVTFLPGMCGKASFTPNRNIATRQHTSVWIYEWISEWTGNRVRHVEPESRSLWAAVSQTWPTWTGIRLHKSEHRKMNQSNGWFEYM